ncbi:hypothetical protein IM40_09550 (plasmid) [Candidatus Paracaedimonas acanthamoebae]|nr:hypothetical protein IM40_09550 [Candidatus Paracaedimonas acanthamoebae]
MGFKTDFETLDFETIVQEMKQSLIKKWKSINVHVDELLESDPAVKIIEIAAYQELYARQSIKESIKKVFVQSAQDKDLENLATLFNLKRLKNEDDNKFRERIMSSRYLEQSAGTKAAYEQCVLSHSYVQDAKALCNEDSKIEIIVLLQVHEEQLFSTLEKEIGRHIEERRVITDYVVLKPAYIHSYQLSAELYLRPGPGIFEVGQQAKRRLIDYIKINYKLGHTISLAGIYNSLTLPGVYKIELKSPLEDIYAKDHEASRCEQIDLKLITPTGSISLPLLGKEEIYA